MPEHEFHEFALYGFDVRAHILTPELARLYDYWQAARPPDGLLPGRAAIDPLDMSYLLGNVILVDVERDPLDFRYRLVGSHIVAAFGFELTGKPVDEHPDPTFRALAREAYTRIATEAVPYLVRRNTVIDRRRRNYENIGLPLAGDGRTVDMILAATWFR